jgi:hypothetical protein
MNLYSRMETARGDTANFVVATATATATATASLQTLEGCRTAVVGEIGNQPEKAGTDADIRTMLDLSLHTNFDLENVWMDSSRKAPPGVYSQPYREQVVVRSGIWYYSPRRMPHRHHYRSLTVSVDRDLYYSDLALQEPHIVREEHVHIAVDHSRGKTYPRL